MKWYFCINEEALPKYSTEIDLAVHSCIRNTSLEPHIIFDGQLGPFADHMSRLGVSVHFGRTSLANDIASLPDGPYDLPGFRHIVARGTFLRYEIANIEFDDEFVLYTDCDVMFRKEFAIEVRPAHLAASPETPDDWSGFNSGVMLLNVPYLRNNYSSLVELSRKRLGMAPNFDQPILNEFYTGRWTRLPLEYNWRPYWGFNEDAAIVHLHQGPKIAVIRQLLEAGSAGSHDLNKYSRSEIVHERWRRAFEMSPDGYRRFLAEGDSINSGTAHILGVG